MIRTGDSQLAVGGSFIGGNHAIEHQTPSFGVFLLPIPQAPIRSYVNIKGFFVDLNRLI